MYNPEVFYVFDELDPMRWISLWWEPILKACLHAEISAAQKNFCIIMISMHIMKADRYGTSCTSGTHFWCYLVSSVRIYFSTPMAETHLPYVIINSFYPTVSPKRKYTLLSSWVLKIEGGQMKGRGWAKPTTELVQTGPSLILKFKEMAAHLLEFQNEVWSSLDQLNGGCVASPTFPVAPFSFEYLALSQVYTFLAGHTTIIFKRNTT